MRAQAILASLLVLGFVGSALGVGTLAYFSDVESTTGNMIMAGTIDLAVNDENPWDQAGVVIDDLKPCRAQYVTVKVKNVGGNPGKLYLHFDNIVCSGGEQTEPELEEAERNGGVDDNHIHRVVKVDIDNEWIGYMDNIASEQYFLGILQPGQENTLTLSFHMDENVTNWAQGDTCTFTLEFILAQVGENIFYEVCSEWVQTTQADFDSGVKENVDTSGSPGDVKLITSPEIGTGADGPLTVNTTVYTDSVRSAVSSQSNAGTNVVYVSTTSGFAPGQEVLIIQMLGTGAGNWETRIIQSVGSGQLTLTQNLTYTYYVGSNKAQVIKIPQYTNVTVNSGGVLTCAAWDGSTGGVIFFRACTVTVNSGGLIDANAKGFPGGTRGNGGSGGSGGAGGAGGSTASNGANGQFGTGGGAGGAGGEADWDPWGPWYPWDPGYPGWGDPDGGRGGNGGGYGNAGATGTAGTAGSGPAGGAANSGGNNGSNSTLSVMQAGSGGSGGNGGSGGTGAGGGGGGGGGWRHGTAGSAGGSGGSGGRGGDGGRGGGIIVINACSIVVNGNIRANGTAGSAGSNGSAGGAGGRGGNGGNGCTNGYGAGGGGGGGKGATGGNGGNGGGGGAGGTIWLKANTITGASNAVAAGGSGSNGGSVGSVGAGGAGGSTGSTYPGQNGSPGPQGPNGSSGATGGSGGSGKIKLDNLQCPTSGRIASQVLDTGYAGAVWKQLSWNETLQPGSDITFEVRASDTPFTKDSPTPSWMPVGGTSPVASGLPSGRYMQWRATLTKTQPCNTPILHDVTVYYCYTVLDP